MSYQKLYFLLTAASLAPFYWLAPPFFEGDLNDASYKIDFFSTKKQIFLFLNINRFILRKFFPALGLVAAGRGVACWRQQKRP
ncbi:MAG: hypothetical protein K6G31_09190 [Paludibacteraceae bacterium]|nr:hypothetical protein [Paludibacteraceae bacterium]